LLQTEQRLEDQISNFEHSLQENEKKTVWKINDCEELLKKRINDEFVTVQIQKLEQKIAADVLSLSQDEEGAGQRDQLHQHPGGHQPEVQGDQGEPEREAQEQQGQSEEAGGLVICL